MSPTWSAHVYVLRCLSHLRLLAPTGVLLVAQTTILLGDALAGVQQISSNAVQCVVTSPPYFHLRNYVTPGQIGLEETPDLYVARLVEVFREVRRVLRDDGVLFLDIADTYNSKKSLIGIPWMLAFALKADSWILRDSIVWQKPNAMPSSATDRCTPSYETVFMFTKSLKYFFDADAISEEAVCGSRRSTFTKGKTGSTQRRTSTLERVETERRNARNVWSISTQPFIGAHFAVMPSALADRCIRAGSKPGDLILDPFLGAATTALAANRIDREAVGCELNPSYADISVARLMREGYRADIFD